MAYKIMDPNKMESGINEYISITGDKRIVVKNCLIVGHIPSSWSDCSVGGISIHFRYKASAIFIM